MVVVTVTLLVTVAGATVAILGTVTK